MLFRNDIDSFACVCSLLLACVPLTAAPKTTEKLRNEKVAASDAVLQPGQIETVSASLPSVTVFFEDASFEVTPSGGKPQKVSVKRGEPVYLPGQPRTIKNTGAKDLHYARVEFLGTGANQMWGKGGLAPDYKLLQENQYGRVYDIQIPAHGNEPQHSHRDRVVVCLSGAKLKHRFPDGKEEPSTLTTGEIAWRRGGVHIGENLGDTDLWVIAIEPK